MSSIPATAAAAPAVLGKTKPWFIKSPGFDLVWFIGMPLLSCVFVATVAVPRLASDNPLFTSMTSPMWLLILAGTVTFTHINVTVSRVYLNKSVFARFKKRLVLVPTFVLLGMLTSSWFFFAMGVLALFWDEWHSLMQTFGFGRIYDARMGNDPNVGRRLDMVMCFVFEWLPYFILATFYPLGGEGDIFQTGPEVAALRNAAALPIEILQYTLITFAVGYTLFYIASYWRLVKRGYRIAPAKIVLYVCTASANLMMVLFFSFIEAGAMANIYHGLQYIAIIWVSERLNLAQLIGLNKFGWGVWAAFLLLLVPTVGAAFYRAVEPTGPQLLLSFWLVCSLLHFWSDGFVWSVRKQQAV